MVGSTHGCFRASTKANEPLTVVLHGPRTSARVASRTMPNRRSPYVDRVTSDGIWTGDGPSWMYRALPVHPVFWQTAGQGGDSLVHIFDTLAASLHEALLTGSDARELHLLAVARDGPAETKVPQGICGMCGTSSGSGVATPITAASRPRAAVFAAGVRLGAYGPPPERGTPLRRTYTALTRRRAPASGARSGRFYERVARAFDIFRYMATHPYDDPGAGAAASALMSAGARQLDSEQVDRLLGWPARSASLQDCFFIESPDGESVEVEAWSEDLSSGCEHVLAGGLQFGVVPVPAAAEASIGAADLAGAFVQRPGIVAVSVRAWLRRSGSVWRWSDISALAAFRTAEGHAPDLDGDLMDVRVAQYRQMRALDEMCPLSPRRGVYLPEESMAVMRA